MPTPCFLILPTGEASRSLRRYCVESTCPIDTRYHGAETRIGVAPLELTPRKYPAELAISRDDPRWPARCACGYRFRDTDQWQTIQEELFEATDGRRFTTRLGDAPPGAMWHARYMADAWAGPDGLCLYVVLPSGEHWGMDCPSRDGGHWKRDGNAPFVNVTPSILTSRYHGFLTNGILTDDLEGRTY